METQLHNAPTDSLTGEQQAHPAPLGCFLLILFCVMSQRQVSSFLWKHRGNPGHGRRVLQKSAVLPGDPEEGPEKEGNTFLVHETQSQLFCSQEGQRDLNVETGAVMSFRQWLI